MMEPFHHEQLPVHRIMELIYWRGRSGNVGIVIKGVPSRLFPFYPFSYPLSVVFSGETGDSLDESSQPLSQRPVVRRLPCVLDEKKATELTAKCLTNRFGHLLDLSGQLESGMQHTVGELGGWEQLPETLFGTVEPVGQYPFGTIERVNCQSGLLKLTVRGGKRGGRLGSGVPQMPDDPPTANRGQVDPFVQAMAVLFVGDEVLGQR